MKKNPGRKERRDLQRRRRREEGKHRAHMHIIEQRKAAKKAIQEAKKAATA